MDYFRQYDILNPNKLIYKVTIIGAGGIENITAFTLAKMGVPNITIYDFDTVESHNIPNQLFYKPTDIGKLKVEALAQNIYEFIGTRVKTINEKFIGDALQTQNLEGIVISAVDTPETRRIIWSAIKLKPKICLFIDGRIGGETLQVFTIRPCRMEDIEIYENNLKTKEQAAELPCSAQTIIYTPVITAGLMALKFKKWVKGEKYFRKVSFLLNTGTYLTQYEI